MNTYQSSEDLAISEKRSLERLARAIALSQGQFSLILVSCNCPIWRQKLIKRLHETSSVPIQEIIVSPAVNTLFTTIFKAVENAPPSALMVSGLESVADIDQMLSATNLVRDEFRKQFSFPLVLWINDRILQKLIRLAPDFKAWDLNPIRFNSPNNQLFDLAG